MDKVKVGLTSFYALTVIIRVKYLGLINGQVSDYYYVFKNNKGQ